METRNPRRVVVAQRSARARQPLRAQQVRPLDILLHYIAQTDAASLFGFAPTYASASASASATCPAARQFIWQIKSLFSHNY